MATFLLTPTNPGATNPVFHHLKVDTRVYAGTEIGQRTKGICSEAVAALYIA
jgi:hypothetical protein